LSYLSHYAILRISTEQKVETQQRKKGIEMAKLNISNKDFESVYHDSEKRGGNTHAEYIYSNVDVFTTLKIDDKEYHVNYQAGHDFYHNDYNLPCEEISMQEAAGTDCVIAAIEQMYESNFDDKETAKEILAEKGIYFTVDEAYQIYIYIRNNLDIDADREYSNLIESSKDEIESSLQEKEDEKAMFEDIENC